MIELRNRQYTAIFDCVALADMEVGQLVRLVELPSDQEVANLTDAEMLGALPATEAGHVSGITGPLFAFWINDRSTAVLFSGGADGIEFPVAGAEDEDANQHIPSGKRMLALGGKGMAEFRFFPESLHDEDALENVVPGDTLQFNGTSSKLQAAGGAGVVDLDVAFVLENDDVSISVVVG
jgi:hypothetical protein